MVIFTTDRSKAVAPVWFVLCAASSLLDAGPFKCFVLFNVLSCLAGLLWYCDHLVEDDSTGCFTFRWFVTCGISAVVCQAFLLVSLID